MSRLDDLPPDQRAVLSLLVRQGKSHAEIADMLGIPQQAVRDRAGAALDALAEESPAPHTAARQQARTEDVRPPAAAGSSAARSPAASTPIPAKTPGSASSLSGSLPSSRRGGALLLGALVVIVVVVVILITSGGGSNKASSTQASTTTPSTAPSETKTSGASSTPTSTSTAKQGASPTVDKQIALTSPEPGSKTVGLVEVVSEKSKHAVYIAAEHLPQPPSGSFYAVWLSNSPSSSTPLGKTPAVGANGRLQAGTLLPANAGDYKQILLTRETSTKAAQPGPTVLSGAFSLGGH
jgi:hypothetical protein